MMWLKALAFLGMALGAWNSFKAMGTPVYFRGRRYYLQSYGTIRRWYGGRGFRPDEIGL